MTYRSRSPLSGVAVFASLLLFPVSAGAAELPPIKTSESNRVAECATPGRLMAYLRERNPKLNPRYEMLASEYMRHGEALHVRWDYAFFQMLLETGHLTYGGDVKAEQNNFAGLGATGKGARGERFPDVATGARAHLEHLVMYSGERVENPVAERTRNIQDWGVLTDWQKGIRGPITFTQLAKQWAPGSRRYSVDIETIASRFFDGPCKDADPQPELVAAISGKATTKTAAAGTTSKTQRRSVDVAKADSAGLRSSLGATEKTSDAAAPAKGAAVVAAAAPDAKAPAQAASATLPITLLNAAPAVDNAGEAAGAESAKAGKEIEVAALPSTMNDAGKAAKTEAKAQKPEKKADKKDAGKPGKCRVWTASYGGSKAIIIKAVQDKTVNYTVLDVNDGSEKREADAYINAYAKGGQSVGEFASQGQALEKAFELCPEG